ncbi:mycothiol synthase [Gryllotalpicola protaetiae]|uniref:Mycothiol synthase n=1 Tax=Gryllotalpicola protaetiae TaxID=2419771 RepID=A0A387BPC1_9MICO|nr:mycothiol synthase [Gryllotalpicola protaetiae]AYG02850.1 mycothiol synthase [Gryllotalpicola protaetiae]
MTRAAIELVETDASAGAALLEPFDEQTSFDVAAGRRRLFALRTTPDEVAAGSAVLGGGSLDLFVHQELRARGLGGAAAAELLKRAGDGPLTAWSHGDHPAARALAVRLGFARARTLLQLRSPVDGFDRATPARTNITTFRPGDDDAAWVALNARVFAWHAEQGGLTQADLKQREAEPWFRADDFLLARDDDGTMIGYCWLKIEPDEPSRRSAAAGTAPTAGSRGEDARTMATGEIYVIGVAPEASGRGLGRTLMTAGLTRLRERGCAEAELYVEADNHNAVHLYRSLGFRDHRVHVQYARA